MRRALSGSDLNVPDGMPIVWLGRLQGHDLPRRVYGPELFEQFLRETQHCGYRHFFYGGSQPTLDALEKSLKASFSRIQIAGCYSPPFRTLTAEEESDAIEMITRASPDVLWVGLGCPKQELWMCEQSMRLRVPVMVGVGQAFNIYAGQLRQAPRWMRESGLEWLFRLCLEPRRLWKRYVVYNSLFLYYLTLERLGFKSFDR
jgi:N-acetylglucosaminyldiphosphoundecaprenol N-acetyl-beta-D-mannosaminyltransferase